MKYFNSIIGLLLLITSCKRKELTIEPIQAKPKCQISKIEYLTNVSLMSNIDYDVSGRIFKFAEKNYSYNGSRVNISGANLEITLNELGYVITSSTKESYVLQEDIVNITRITEYTYNEENYLVKEITTSISISSTSSDTKVEEYNYEYKNGNLSTSSFTKWNGVKTQWNYTYTDFLNQLGELEGKLFFKGKQSKNLISTTEQLTNGQNPKISIYTYSFDKNENLTSETITSDNKVFSNRTFSWTCKD